MLALLHRHLELTGSRRADEMLLGWHSAGGNFLRVCPLGQATARLPHLLHFDDQQPEDEEAA